MLVIAAVLMHLVSDPCAALRDDPAWPCSPVVSKPIRGLGSVDVLVGGSVNDVRWALAIHAGSETWVSDAMLEPMSDCSADHCFDVSGDPVITAIHPDGRAAVVLELALTKQWTREDTGAVENRERSKRYLVCGKTGTGKLACMHVDPAPGCTIAIRDDGNIQRTCREHVELGP